MHIVQHVDAVSVEVDDLGGRKVTAGAAFIDVAADCCDGRDLLECVDDVGITDVAAVYYMVDARQGVVEQTRRALGR